MSAHSGKTFDSMFKYTYGDRRRSLLITRLEGLCEVFIRSMPFQKGLSLTGGKYVVPSIAVKCISQKLKKCASQMTMF